VPNPTHGLTWFFRLALLARSDVAKDAEILVLQHGLAGSSISLIFLIGAMTRPLNWAASCCMAESRSFSLAPK
jgi:hypothetical protein